MVYKNEFRNLKEMFRYLLELDKHDKREFYKKEKLKEYDSDYRKHPF